ncbi:helix-turn-helix domain-containing protein [Epilithonimonas sp.]|uniref:helix-turn-helix domain-containing protein n=1 Tax=Epilithonimonas sp. TaxID=2894511 RepID=UPI0028A0564C|nr:helix-turn-helix domain-containing protein [Epilithonimonas sp.]
MLTLQLSVSDTKYIRAEIKQIVVDVLEELLLKKPDNPFYGLSIVTPDELPKNNLLLESKENNFLTRKEVSEMLKVSLATLSNWQKSNVLIPLKIGKRVLYKIEDVKERLQKQESNSKNSII